MIVAQAKKKENIIEYLLYMFNIENTIRTLNFDIKEIDSAIINQYEVDDTKKDEIKHWYLNLIKEMRSSGITEQGHLEELHEIITELNLLHNTLLSLYQDDKYNALNEKSKEAVVDLVKKSGKKNIGYIEACIVGLFGLLTLRMSNKQISPATEAAFTNISELLALLAIRYNEMKLGKLDLPLHQRN